MHRVPYPRGRLQVRERAPGSPRPAQQTWPSRLPFCRQVIVYAGRLRGLPPSFPENPALFYPYADRAASRRQGPAVRIVGRQTASHPQTPIHAGKPTGGRGEALTRRRSLGRGVSGDERFVRNHSPGMATTYTGFALAICRQVSCDEQSIEVPATFLRLSPLLSDLACKRTSFRICSLPPSESGCLVSSIAKLDEASPWRSRPSLRLSMPRVRPAPAVLHTTSRPSPGIPRDVGTSECEVAGPETLPVGRVDGREGCSLACRSGSGNNTWVRPLPLSYS